MAEQICYIQLNRNVEVSGEDVFFSDVGNIYCKNRDISNRVKSLKVYKFKPEETRCFLGILQIISLMQENCPCIQIESLGEADVVIERKSAARLKQSGATVKALSLLKILFVCAISFFGTAFTIMAYHNDIGIANVFTRIHEIITGEEPQGLSVLEISYSLGLSLGIIVFFNHVGGHRLTKDPTPIEVEMRIYEKEVNDALIDTAQREGKKTDVE